MKCLTPLHIRRPGSRHPGDIIDVPCGRCVACLARRRAEWTTRLICESLTSQSSLFVTLTYDEDHVTKNVSKTDIQLFIKRLRKVFAPTKIRYYLVSEYGPTTLRPHYHCLFFDLPCDLLYLKDSISQAWGKGFISIGQVNPRSISYVCKYHIDRFNTPEGLEPTFCLMSTHPFIGSKFLQKYAPYALQDCYSGKGKLPSIHVMGDAYQLPPAFRRRIMPDFRFDSDFTVSPFMSYEEFTSTYTNCANTTAYYRYVDSFILDQERKSDRLRQLNNKL